MDGLFTMGPDEAAFAVERLIRPTTVIPEHINQVSTSGGVVVPGLRLDAFIDKLHEGRIVVPLSGLPITCDGKGNCTGPGLIERDRGRDHSH
jgi:L-ascorbate metabolism protein UlaG (beta-lactamase superfamily)